MKTQILRMTQARITKRLLIDSNFGRRDCQKQVKKSTILVCIYKVKPYLLLYSLYYAEVCNEFAGPIFASLRPGGNTASSKEMSPRWRAVGNAVFDLTGPRFESQTSRYRDEDREVNLLVRLTIC